MRNIFAACGIVLALTATSQAALIGTIELADTNVSAFSNGSPTTVDVYQYIISGTDEIVTGLDFTSANNRSFSGEFVQGLSTFSTDPNLQNVGVLLADTFFVSPVAGPSAAQIEDSANVLGATYAFTASPIDFSQGDYIAATFSVPAGAAAPMLGAELPVAVVQGVGEVAIGVPEPASLALVGLGIAGVVARRRRV